MAEAARSGEPVALGIITGVKGSSPQKVGAKALFYADGRIKGTLGGGCLEAEIQQRAVQSLRTGQGATFDLLLDHDFGWDDGLMCGGKVCGLILPNAQRAGEAFWTELAERKQTMAWGVKGDYSITRVPRSEAFDVPQVLECASPLALWGRRIGWTRLKSVRGLAQSKTPAQVIGFTRKRSRRHARCGLRGQGTSRRRSPPLALQLDFSVTVFDDRPALANHQFFPPEVTLQADVWEKLMALPLPAAPSFGLIVTRGHRHDALVLKEWIHRPFLFLGMIGSARKARTMFEHFTEEKLATPGELAARGLPGGGQDPLAEPSGNRGEHHGPVH